MFFETDCQPLDWEAGATERPAHWRLQLFFLLTVNCGCEMVQAKHDSRETIFLSTLIIKNRGVFFDFLHCHFRALLTCSGIPKAEGLRPKSKVSHLRLRLRWPMVYAAEGRRSSQRLKLLKLSKFKCKFCDKNFRMIKVYVCSVFKKV